MEFSFQELFEESFPAASPELRAKFKSFLASERTDYKWLFAPRLRDHLSQGDVLAGIPPFFFDGREVKVSKQLCPFVLLEHTCNMSVDDGEPRNSHYSFIPLFPFELIVAKGINKQALQKNLIHHKIFLSEIPGFDNQQVGDLNLVGSLESTWLHRSVRDGGLRRICSLSSNGYFFFLAKLTAHFLRADTSQFQAA